MTPALPHPAAAAPDESRKDSPPSGHSLRHPAGRERCQMWREQVRRSDRCESCSGKARPTRSTRRRSRPPFPASPAMTGGVGTGSHRAASPSVMTVSKMSVWAHCLLALIAVGGCRGALKPCKAWDDGYTQVISGMTEQMVGDSDVARRLFVNPLAAASPNAQDESYQRTRELASSAFAGASEAVRLEMSGLEYECVWLARMETTAKLLVTRGGRVSLRELPMVRWEHLREGIEKAWSNQSLRSYVDLGVQDGSIYYVSICLEGRSAQFAFYGLSEELWERYGRLRGHGVRRGVQGARPDKSATRACGRALGLGSRRLECGFSSPALSMCLHRSVGPARGL